MKKQNTQGDGKARPAAKNTPASVPTTGGRPPASPAPTKARKSKGGEEIHSAAQGRGEFRSRPDVRPLAENDDAINHMLSRYELERIARGICLRLMTPEQREQFLQIWRDEFIVDYDVKKRKAGDTEGEEWKRGRGA